jgi:hypothetical protein
VGVQAPAAQGEAGLDAHGLPSCSRAASSATFMAG